MDPEPDGRTTTSNRRLLLALGIGLIVLGLVVALAAGVRGFTSFFDAVSTPVIETPTVEGVELDTGPYGIYEWTASSSGPVTFTEGRGTTLTAEQVVVTDPSGEGVRVRRSGGIDETITQGGRTYRKVLEFRVAEPGTHIVAVRGSEPGAVLVAPPLGETFRGMIRTFIVMVAGGVVLVAGGIVLVLALRRPRA